MDECKPLANGDRFGRNKSGERVTQLDHDADTMEYEAWTMLRTSTRPTLNRRTDSARRLQV